MNQNLLSLGFWDIWVWIICTNFWTNCNFFVLNGTNSLRSCTILPIFTYVKVDCIGYIWDHSPYQGSRPFRPGKGPKGATSTILQKYEANLSGNSNISKKKLSVYRFLYLNVLIIRVKNSYKPKSSIFGILRYSGLNNLHKFSNKYL